MKYKMNLHLFEGDGGAGAAPATGGDGGEAAVKPGVLEDGTVVDDRLAARMEEQARKRKARGEEPAKIAPMAKQQAKQPAQAAQPNANPDEPSLEDQWNEAKKGKYRELYGRDVQAAVNDRFKNQQNASEELSALEPMLKVMRDQYGVANNVDLVSHYMDNDDLYEEEAESRGMTVESVKLVHQLEQENARYKAREQQEAESMFIRQHLEKLARQAEDLKQIYPNFDLRTELQNETFARLTAPNSWLDVKTAYYAVHHDELEPQAMAYGIQRAQQQISQTLQANQRRPMEGAAQRGQPPEVTIDVNKLTREEMQNMKDRAARGERIVF